MNGYRNYLNPDNYKYNNYNDISYNYNYDRYNINKYDINNQNWYRNDSCRKYKFNRAFEKLENINKELNEIEQDINGLEYNNGILSKIGEIKQILKSVLKTKQMMLYHDFENWDYNRKRQMVNYVDSLEKYGLEVDHKSRNIIGYECNFLAAKKDGFDFKKIPYRTVDKEVLCNDTYGHAIRIIDNVRNGIFDNKYHGEPSIWRYNYQNINNKYLNNNLRYNHYNNYYNQK